MSLRCPFKRNMIVEVIDKYRVSDMRIGKISEVVRNTNLFLFLYILEILDRWSIENQL